MSDNMRAPVGKAIKGEGEAAEDKEAQETDEQISDDPVVEEEKEDEAETSYNPAVQAPTEAER